MASLDSLAQSQALLQALVERDLLAFPASGSKVRFVGLRWVSFTVF
jgi:hypothetical protein